VVSELYDNETHQYEPPEHKSKDNIDNHVFYFIRFTKCCQYDYNYTMPKKTRLQKLRNQMRTDHTFQPVQTAVMQNDFLSVDPMFKKDMIKSVFFAIFITAFEIALYFIYYLHVFERR